MGGGKHSGQGQVNPTKQDENIKGQKGGRSEEPTPGQTFEEELYGEIGIDDSEPAGETGKTDEPS